MKTGGETMYKNIDYKFLDCARKMPALYNTLPGEQYDIKKSEVISWLVKQPEIQRKIFEMAKAQRVIEYDKDLKKWKGICYLLKLSNDFNSLLNDLIIHSRFKFIYAQKNVLH